MTPPASDPLSLVRREFEALRDPVHREYLVGRARAEAVIRAARLRGRNIELAGPTRFVDGQAPEFRGSGTVSLGPNNSFRGGPVRSRFSTGPDGVIRSGDKAGFNFGFNMYADELIEIGGHAMVGAMVTIYDTNFHEVDEGGVPKVAPVRIGHNVWLGHAAIILPGVTIGDHSVIAAGAVVTRDVPDRTVMVGNPARPAREITASDGWARW